MLKYEP